MTAHTFCKQIGEQIARELSGNKMPPNPSVVTVCLLWCSIMCPDKIVFPQYNLRQKKVMFSLTKALFWCVWRSQSADIYVEAVNSRNEGEGKTSGMWQRGLESVSVSLKQIVWVPVSPFITTKGAFRVLAQEIRLFCSLEYHCRSVHAGKAQRSFKHQNVPDERQLWSATTPQLLWRNCTHIHTH